MRSIFNKHDAETRGAIAVGEGVSELYESNPRIVAKLATIMAIEGAFDSEEGREAIKISPIMKKLLAETAEKAAILSHNMELGLQGTFPWSMLGIDPNDVARIIEEHNLIKSEEEGRDV